MTDLQRVRPDAEKDYVAQALTQDVRSMSFTDIVEWTRHLGRDRERESEESGMIDLSNPDHEMFSDEDRRLLAFLEAVPSAQISRLHTLYYVGRDFDEDPPGMHDYLRDERDDDYRVTLLEKMPLDEYLGRGLMILYRLRVDPEQDWHVNAPQSRNDHVPRDFVLDPPPTFHLAQSHRASLVELLDALTHQRWVPLVSADDPPGGEFSRCITVSHDAADSWIERGFRELTPEEVRAVYVGWRKRAGLPPEQKEHGWFLSGVNR